MASVCHLSHSRDQKVAYPIAELNVKEIRPPKMDDSGRTKYPVLFRVFVASPEVVVGKSLLT